MAGINSNTALMIHSWTTDGSTTFTDSGPTVHACTDHGGVHHTTDLFKFGTTSIEFDGAGDYIDVASYTDLDFGSGEFTIDFWYAGNDSGNNTPIIARDDKAFTPYIIFVYNQLIRLYIANATYTGWALFDFGDLPVENNVFHHFAFVRYSGEIKAYRDGNELASQVFGNTIPAGSGSLPLQIGYSAYWSTPTSSLKGWLDEIRIHKSAYWKTAEFTPPTEPYSTTTVNDITLDENFTLSSTLSSDDPESIPASDDFIFECTLTGIEDGLDDLIIPISSFQVRLMAEGKSFVSVVAPGDDLWDDIADRQNGRLMVQNCRLYNGEVVQRETVGYCKLEEIRIDKGSVNVSATLSGYQAIPKSGAEIDIEKVTYKSISSGKISVRTPVIDYYLKPGDTVTADGETFVVGSISISVSESQRQMQITEADEVEEEE